MSFRASHQSRSYEVFSFERRRHGIHQTSKDSKLNRLIEDNCLLELYNNQVPGPVFINITLI